MKGLVFPKKMVEDYDSLSSGEYQSALENAITGFEENGLQLADNQKGPKNKGNIYRRGKTYSERMGAMVKFVYKGKKEFLAHWDTNRQDKAYRVLGVEVD